MQCHHTSRLGSSRSLFDTCSQLAMGEESQAMPFSSWASVSPGLSLFPSTAGAPHPSAMSGGHQGCCSPHLAGGETVVRERKGLV